MARREAGGPGAGAPENRPKTSGSRCPASSAHGNLLATEKRRIYGSTRISRIHSDSFGFNPDSHAETRRKQTRFSVLFFSAFSAAPRDQIFSFIHPELTDY
jgi:hypothetical protein